MHRTIDELKRRAYLVVALIGLASTVVAWFLGGRAESSANAMALFHTVAYTVLTLTWLLLACVLYTSTGFPHNLERRAIGVFATYYLFRLIFVLFFSGDLDAVQIRTEIVDRGNWQLLALSAAILLAYNYRTGAQYVAGLFIASLSLYAMKLSSLDGISVSQLVQLFVAQLHLVGSLVLLGFLSRIKDQWIKVDREAQAMRRLALIDPLTEVSNRRRLDAALAEEIRTGRTPFTVIMFDIDSFKEINDTYGHIIGDEVLVATAGIVQSIVRQGDAFGRWGGEEFLVLCPSTDLVKGWQIAERLREAISSHVFDHVGVITASFGVAEYRPGETPDELLTRADNVLYLAKTRGKNRVEAAPEHPVA